MTNKSIWCKLGFHSYSVREVHIEEKFTNSVHMHSGIKAAIIGRCECGKAKITDGIKKTVVVLPEKYKYEKPRYEK